MPTICIGGGPQAWIPLTAVTREWGTNLTVCLQVGPSSLGSCLQPWAQVRGLGGIWWCHWHISSGLRPEEGRGVGTSADSEPQTRPGGGWEGRPELESREGVLPPTRSRPPPVPAVSSRGAPGGPAPGLHSRAEEH